VPGTPYSQRHLREIFDRAIRDADARMAWSAARGLKTVELDRALALTTLLGREGDPRYLHSARRFLCRFLAEAGPTLGQVRKVADALDRLGRLHELPAMPEGADRALADLGRQLRDRAR
jgi:hypothetical protein